MATMENVKKGRLIKYTAQDGFLKGGIVIEITETRSGNNNIYFTNSESVKEVVPFNIKPIVVEKNTRGKLSEASIEEFHTSLLKENLDIATKKIKDLKEEKEQIQKELSAAISNSECQKNKIKELKKEIETLKEANAMNINGTKNITDNFVYKGICDALCSLALEKNNVPDTISNLLNIINTLTRQIDK